MMIQDSCITGIIKSIWLKDNMMIQDNIINILSGEPLLFKSSFTPVYDFGFVGLAVNKVSHHYHPKCGYRDEHQTYVALSRVQSLIRFIRTTLASLWFG